VNTNQRLQELTKLADFLADFSNVQFTGDVVASMLDDISAGVTANEIFEDLQLDDPGNYE
jgi:hypothetical protein